MKDTPESALYAAFFLLVETLDKRGVLSVADFATAVGESLDFRNSMKNAKITDNSNLRYIYDSLLAMEQSRHKIEALKSQLQALQSRGPSEPEA